MAEPEWGDFKIMLALGRGGSVAGAARILGVDSSTISRRLAALEEALGATLILRGGREFSLTNNGKEAFATAEDIESSIAKTASAIRATKLGFEGEVRITCVTDVVGALVPFHEVVKAKHPNLSVQYVSTGRSLDLTKGEADIAIRFSKPTEPALIARPAFEMGLGVYAARSYLELNGTPKCHEDLKGHKLVQYGPAMLHLPWFSWIEKYSDPHWPATRVETTEAAASVINNGGGIGVIACFGKERKANLVRIFPEPIALVPAWIVYHESTRNTARIRAVVDMLADYLKDLRPALSGAAPK